MGQHIQKEVPFNSIIFVVDKDCKGIQFLKYIKKHTGNFFLGQIYKLRTDLPKDFNHQHKIGEYITAKLHSKEPVLLKKKIEELSKKDQEHLLTDRYAILCNKNSKRKSEKK